MKRTVLVLLALAVGAAVSSATVYVVNPEGTGDFETIQQAVDNVVAGDVIQLTNGVFTGPGNRDVNFAGKAIMIQSQSTVPSQCIIDCEDEARGFIFRSSEGAQSVLTGIRIHRARGVYSPWYEERGGGVVCSNSSSPTIINMEFTNCYAAAGAGVFCYQGCNPVLTKCIFKNNEATSTGGGISCLSAPVVTDCQFLGNTSYTGGGMYCTYYVSAQITQCRFVANTAHLGGGLMASSHSDPVLTQCQFINNAATSTGGGMIAYWDCGASLSECTFRGNTSEIDGGGMAACMYSNTTLDFCDFTFNSAPEGGGMFLHNGANATITNCTFSNNSATDGGGISVSANTEPVIENTVIVFSRSGEAVYCVGGASATLSCCDIYGNAGGDWVGCIAGQAGINDNFSADPIICPAWSVSDPPGIRDDSPCAPENNPECGLVGAWPVGCSANDEALQPMESGPASPARLLFATSNPNPFHHGTQITYTISGSEGAVPVQLDVYDLAGRRVRTLVSSSQSAGTHAVDWDGTDDGGRAVDHGIYLYRIQAGDATLTRKLIFLP